jgi:hypothetical protein
VGPLQVQYYCTVGYVVVLYTRATGSAECCDCHQLQMPGIASFLLLPEKQAAEYARNQRQAYAAQMVRGPVATGPPGARVQTPPVPLLVVVVVVVLYYYL